MVTTTHMLQSLTTTTALLNRTSSITVCCFSSRNGGRSGGSRWDSRAGNGQQRFRFDEEELRANGGEKDAEFGFGAATKQRIWWSDDDSSRGDSFDDEDEDFEGFGELEGSIGFSWIFKEHPMTVQDQSPGQGSGHMPEPKPMLEREGENKIPRTGRELGDMDQMKRRRKQRKILVDGMN